MSLRKTMGSPKHIKEQIKKFKEELAPASLLAVTKYSKNEDLIHAYEVGQRDFGESRVQELALKAQKLEEMGHIGIHWHFIGHLQTNKVNRLLKTPGLSFIHSVDSLKLLETLYKKQDLFEGDRLNFFLEIKTTDEEEKSGILDGQQLVECIRLIQDRSDSVLNFYGLMTMGAIRTENFNEDARTSFKKLREIRDRIQNNYNFHDLKLSMGMSSDYQMALDEGTDWVRIGSAIFKD